MPHETETQLIDSDAKNNSSAVKIRATGKSAKKRSSIDKALESDKPTAQGPMRLLMRVASNGFSPLVETILRLKGRDIKAQNEMRQTALMLAATEGNSLAVKTLLGGQELNIDAQNEMRQTALMLAAKNGHREVVALLLQKGAEVNRTDKNGCTALIYAVRNGHRKVVALLLEKGADINLQDKANQTALTYAAMYNCREVVALLLEKGATAVSGAPQHLDSKDSADSRNPRDASAPITLQQAFDQEKVDTVVSLSKLNPAPSGTSNSADNKPQNEVKLKDSYPLIISGRNQPSANRLEKLDEDTLADVIFKKKEHKEKLLEGIERYLQYHLHNRTTLFGYLNPFHGKTGRRRALALKKVLEKENIDKASLHEWLRQYSQSGNREHSLRNYIRRAIGSQPQKVASDSSNTCFRTDGESKNVEKTQELHIGRESQNCA